MIPNIFCCVLLFVSYTYPLLICFFVVEIIIYSKWSYFATLCKCSVWMCPKLLYVCFSVSVTYLLRHGNQCEVLFEWNAGRYSPYVIRGIFGWPTRQDGSRSSVAEPEPHGAATFRGAPEPEPIYFPVGARSRSRTFKAAPAAYFMQAKKKSIVLVSNMTLKAVKKGKYGQKYNCIHNSPFKRSKGKILVCGAGAGAAWSRLFLPGVTFFCLEPEPTQVGWSRLRDLRHLEPEPPKKVTAPQHCWKGKASTNIVI